MKTAFQTLLLAAATAAFVSSQGTETADKALSADSTVSCDDIIADSDFSGDCCALNRTSGGGCILSVINGYCKVRGQTWSLDYTSTYDSDGAECPASEIPVGEFLPTSSPTMAPNDSDAGASIHMAGAVMGASVVAAALAALIM